MLSFFGGTIRKICTEKTDATHDEIVLAPKQAMLLILSKDSQNNLKLLLENAVLNFLEDKRQRIAMSRDFVKSSILILDEATSSLDSESEKLVQETWGTWKVAQV
jgi:ABC-type multidrug transport system fused ATPase/permease subunit